MTEAFIMYKAFVKCKKNNFNRSATEKIYEFHKEN